MRRSDPIISIVFATHNRKDLVLRTIERVRDCVLDRVEFELIAVDNASADDTADVIEPHVDRLIRLHGNRGSTAKAYGADYARGEYLVFLDDDSHPTPGSLPRMIEHFQADPDLGAAGFRVHLPDGREEGGALPGVFVGCGVGFRTSAYRVVGGLDRNFFMQAEEYDLSFRLASKGWHVAVFDDLHVLHEKTAQARRSERTTYFDTRNNLRVVARYVPNEYAPALLHDYSQRYQWLAERSSHERAFQKGKAAGTRRASYERPRFAPFRFDEQTFECFFRFKEIQLRMAALRSQGVRRILLAGMGKNIYPFVRAADLCGLGIAAIADDTFAAPSRLHRGVPIVSVAQAMQTGYDAVVVSNAAPVHAEATRNRVAGLTDKPVHAWFASSSIEPPLPEKLVPAGQGTVAQHFNAGRDRALRLSPVGTIDSSEGSSIHPCPS